jgi:hypothetical protein
MKTTTLGRSSLVVSRIAFGTWQLGGDWGQFNEDAAVTATVGLARSASTFSTPPRSAVSAHLSVSLAARCAMNFRVTAARS